MAGRDWRTILAWVALAFAALEVVTAFFIEEPIVAIVFAALFLLAWLVLRRGGTAGVIIILVLCVIELIGLPFYERDDTDDWIVQILALILGILGLIAGIATLRQRPAPASRP
jgi:hypothetical protein